MSGTQATTSFQYNRSDAAPPPYTNPREIARITYVALALAAIAATIICRALGSRGKPTIASLFTAGTVLTIQKLHWKWIQPEDLKTLRIPNGLLEQHPTCTRINMAIWLTVLVALVATVRMPRLLFTSRDAALATGISVTVLQCATVVGICRIGAGGNGVILGVRPSWIR